MKNNPSAFESAYWTINSLKVYTSSGSTQNLSPATPGNVGLGSSTPDGPITENPTRKEKRAAVPAAVVAETSDGNVSLEVGKREIDTPFNSVVEQPTVTKRSIADGGEEMYIKKGKVIRHLRRHQMGGFGHHHS